jgi:hypothetical protein
MSNIESAQYWADRSREIDVEVAFNALLDAGMDEQAFAVINGTLSPADGMALLPPPAKPKSVDEMTPEEIERILGA